MSEQKTILVWMVLSIQHNQIRFIRDEHSSLAIGEKVCIQYPKSGVTEGIVIGAGYVADTPEVRKAVLKRNPFVSIDIENIVIPDEFVDAPPHVEKLRDRYEEWRKGKQFDTMVVFEKDDRLGDGMYLLKDGYTAFLISKMMGHKKLDGYLEQ